MNYLDKFEFKINKKTFLSVFGNSNDLIISYFLEYKKNNNYSFVLYKDSYKSAKNKILKEIEKNPSAIILDNILCTLELDELKDVLYVLNKYKNNGGIIINVTNDIEEALYGNRIIIINNNSIICDGDVLSVLNEEKLLKRIGVCLPFIIELNKYLMDYNLISDYYLNNKELVGALWK